MLAAEKNRLVRVLSDAGIRLTAVVSDPHGVAARAMIDCLLHGGTPDQALQYAGRLKAPREELLASLQGELSEEHWFVAARSAALSISWKLSGPTLNGACSSRSNPRKPLCNCC
jgi:hypothetical protein